MKEDASQVYVRTDDRGLIIQCEGGITTPADLSGWVQIDEGTGDKYLLCQQYYFPGGLYTDDGIPRYKLQDGVPVERTEDEIQTDRDALPPISGGDDDERISALESEVSALQESIRKGLAM